MDVLPSCHCACLCALCHLSPACLFSLLLHLLSFSPSSLSSFLLFCLLYMYMYTAYSHLPLSCHTTCVPALCTHLLHLPALPLPTCSTCTLCVGLTLLPALHTPPHHSYYTHTWRWNSLPSPSHISSHLLLSLIHIYALGEEPLLWNDTLHIYLSHLGLEREPYLLYLFWESLVVVVVEGGGGGRGANFILFTTGRQWEAWEGGSLSPCLTPLLLPVTILTCPYPWCGGGEEKGAGRRGRGKGEAVGLSHGPTQDTHYLTLFSSPHLLSSLLSLFPTLPTTSLWN